MSKPKRQHFIPRSYLNNFAVKKEDKYFIHGKRKGNNTIEPLSTKDVCVDKNLYTLPTNNKAIDKFAIEHFYADKVDNLFPEIYSVIKDKSITTIDKETREKIIMAALSLYFRTPKFLNKLNKLYEDILKFQHNTGKRGFAFGREKITLSQEEIDAIIKEKKEHNRIQFLAQHLKSYAQFLQAKLSCNMQIHHIIDDSEFITSDNPVIINPNVDPNNIESYYDKDVNPFDSTNHVHLPIDNKTTLIILPSTIPLTPNWLQRLDTTSLQVTFFNSEIEKNSEAWILGSKNSIEKYQKAMEYYNALIPENLKQVEEFKNYTLELLELVQLLEKHGDAHEEVRKKLEEMKAKPFIASDTNFQRLAKKVEE